MTKPRVNRITVVLSLAGGLLTTLELIFSTLVVNFWTWNTSGKHATLDLRNFFEWLDPSGQMGKLGIILWAFAIGTGVVFFLSKRPLQYFLQDPLRSKGWPSTGFIVGFLSAIISCGLFHSVIGIVVATDRSLSIVVLPWVLALYISKAFELIGLPIGLIGGIGGSVSELVLRRIYRAAAPPATSPDK